MRDKRVYSAVAAVAALAILLGSFLPWARFTFPFGEIEKRGLEDGSDGIITLILGLAAIWVVVYYFFVQGTGLVRCLLLSAVGLGAVAVASVDLADTHGRAAGVLGDLEELSQTGVPVPVDLVAAEGLYMVLIAGITLFLTGLAGVLLPPPLAPEVSQSPIEAVPVDAVLAGEAGGEV